MAVIERMRAAAIDFVAALDEPPRARACLPFADEEARTSWFYFPAPRAGLPLAELDASGRRLAWQLVSSGVSVETLARATAIVGLERVLGRIEGSGGFRDPDLYFVTVFGDPSASEPWAWRFEGHHVCINVTVRGDDVSFTPFFLGANPAWVTHGDRTVLRPLAEEEELARELLAGLDRDQRAVAVLARTAPPDLVTRNLPYLRGRIEPEDLFGRPIDLDDAERDAVSYDTDRPKGLPGSAMGAGQRELLSLLVRAYVDRVPGDGRSDRLDVDDIHFAWAGSEAVRAPHYYRLQGAGFLAEYDNTQDGANHVHAVWRDPADDFGAGLLARHH